MTKLIMGDNTAPELISAPEGATRNAKVSCKGQLDSGDLLTGTPTIVEVDADNAVVSPSDLTISGKAVNSSTMEVNEDTTVLAGQGVVYTFSGQLVANSPYRIRTTVSTTPGGQTLVVYNYLTAANK